MQATSSIAPLGIGTNGRYFVDKTAQPFFWSAGMAMSLGASLAAGATLLLQETFDAGGALELIERERPTTLHAWPHQEKTMAEHPTASTRDLSSVRRIEFSSPLAPLVGLERDEWGTYVTLLGQVRTLVMGRVPDAAERKRMFEAMADSDLLERIRAGKVPSAEEVFGDFAGAGEGEESEE